MKAFRLVALFAALFFAGVCSTFAAAQRLTHEATEAKSEIRVQAADQLKIVVPTEAKPGFTWQMISNDNRFLKEVVGLKQGASATATAADKKAVSAAWSITFQAIRRGHSVVRIACVSTNATGEIIPTEVREISVTVE